MESLIGLCRRADCRKRRLMASAYPGGGVLLLPAFNLLVPSFQCGGLRCFRRRSSANNFEVALEDFRLVSVSPHPYPFEPSQMDALCLSFGVHDEHEQRGAAKTVPRGGARVGELVGLNPTVHLTAPQEISLTPASPERLAWLRLLDNPWRFSICGPTQNSLCSTQL